MPVTRDPTAVITDPAGGGRAPLLHVHHQRVEHDPEPVDVGADPPARSTTATLPPSPEPGSPVTSRTGSCTAAASPRSSATTFLASAMLT